MKYNIVSGNFHVTGFGYGNNIKYGFSHIKLTMGKSFSYTDAKHCLSYMYEKAVKDNRSATDPIWDASIILSPWRDPAHQLDIDGDDLFGVQPMTAPTGEIFNLRTTFYNRNIPQNITTTAQELMRGIRTDYNIFVDEYAGIL